MWWCWRAKKERLKALFSLNRVLEKWYMCPWKSLNFLFKKGYERWRAYCIRFLFQTLCLIFFNSLLSITPTFNKKVFHQQEIENAGFDVERTERVRWNGTSKPCTYNKCGNSQRKNVFARILGAGLDKFSIENSSPLAIEVISINSGPTLGWCVGS